MKRLITACFAGLFFLSTAEAAPLCEAFLAPETMPKKYRKLAPVLSGSVTDWILTDDQMDEEYAPSAEAEFLLRQIVLAFEERGTKLAILMPPPRPLVAGQTALDALTDGEVHYNVDAVTASFNQMIEAVQGAGAIAPNLLDLATQSADLRDTYYYRHDTHWTPRGAAASAVALAEAVIAADAPGFAGISVARPIDETTEVFSERGSLADMAKAVCGADIPPVVLPVPAFPDVAEMDLLQDAPSRPRILLAGSSFSDRYKKDAYRVADAIGGALQADVLNHSVSGGGAIGAIEGIVNAGLLHADGRVDLVVWELPYTEGLRNIGMLRQLLGALQFEQGTTTAQGVELDGSGETRIELDGRAPDLLALHLPGTALSRIKVDLRFTDGSKQTMGLVRKRHVPAALQSDWWALSLVDLSRDALDSVTVRHDAEAAGISAQAHLF